MAVYDSLMLSCPRISFCRSNQVDITNARAGWPAWAWSAAGEGLEKGRGDKRIKAGHARGMK